MIFWILTTPRSGSNFITGEICRRLGGEPRGMEFFNPASVARRTDFTPDRDAPVHSYLEYLAARESLGGVLAVKMLWIQIEACCGYPDFVPALSGRKILVLRRRDVVRQGVSLYLAFESGAWISTQAPRSHDTVPYDHEKISAIVARMELHNAMLGRFVTAFGLDHITMWYEDFLAAPEAECDRALAYLGLPRTSAPLSAAETYSRQSTALNEEYRERFLAAERSRFAGDGTYRGPPLFREE
jgi:LPS sulfotransferase NodH